MFGGVLNICSQKILQIIIRSSMAEFISSKVPLK